VCWSCWCPCLHWWAAAMVTAPPSSSRDDWRWPAGCCSLCSVDREQATQVSSMVQVARSRDPEAQRPENAKQACSWPTQRSWCRCGAPTARHTIITATNILTTPSDLYLMIKTKGEEKERWSDKRHPFFFSFSWTK
jgi:hypothetical protein